MPTLIVRILGASLSMEAQVTEVAASAFYHFRLIRQLVSYLSTNDLATVIQAIVTTRLDYCNSLYMDLLLGLIQKL